MAKKTVFDIMKGCRVKVIFKDGSLYNGILKDFDAVNYNKYGDRPKVEFILLKEEFRNAPSRLHIIPVNVIKEIEMETEEDEEEI